MSINLSALMKQRYDTAANWTAQNPTLLAGEIGIESDTKRWKVGTGSTAWTSLLYSNGGTYPLVNADIAAGAAIVDTKLATIATAGKVSNSATTAASANTASAIVARDASGNFTAGTITAALTGAASSNVLKAGDTMTGVLAVTAGTAALPGLAVSGDTNTGIYSPGADQLAISTGGTVKATVDSSGRLLVGTSSTSAGSTVVLQGNSASSVDGAVILLQAGQSAASIGASTGSNLGYIQFADNAGGKFADIRAQSDATAGAGDYPGRLVFSVTADGAASPTERMRITSAGYLKVSDNNSYQAVSVGRHELNQSANEALLMSHVSNTGYTGDVHIFNVNKAANSNYVFLRCYSGTFADTEFNLRGDGNAFADGSWTGGGADYAEYFEWSDSNPNTEDRRGISVVLDGDKIREAVVGEDPIGVISGNPSMVGDAAWNKWSGKYLRDEFGTYIQEDYDVTGDDGKIVTQQRRKLNPAYNPDNEYIPREQRPEWDCVGLMGKLRIRKDQITGSRWIKMRDISPSVEEWLVR